MSRSVFFENIDVNILRFFFTRIVFILSQTAGISINGKVSVFGQPAALTNRLKSCSRVFGIAGPLTVRVS